MLKVLIKSLAILSISFLFIYLIQFDEMITIKFYHYNAKISSFMLMIIYLLSLIFLILIIKIINFIFSIPHFIKQKLIIRTKKINYNYFLEAIIEFTIGNNEKSLFLINKKMKQQLLNNVEQNLILLIQTESEQNIDKKIKYYLQLEKLKEYKEFATKKLAHFFLIEDDTSKSEEYAIKAFYINKKDTENLKTLFYCYSKMHKWIQMNLIVLKLYKTNIKAFLSIKEDILLSYINAIENMLSINNKKAAIKFTNLGFKFSNEHPKILEYYFTLKKIKNTTTIITILSNAFLQNPSFEIVLLYEKFSLLTPEEIYNKLESLVDTQKYLSLFFRIAIYFNLNEKNQIFNEKIKSL